MAKVAIFDFDGTFTLVEQEAQGFRDGYRNDIAERAGIPLDELTPIWDTWQAAVRLNPRQHSWIFDHMPVSPAADPYLRCRPVAIESLRYFGKCVDDLDVDDLRAIKGNEGKGALELLFKRNHPKARTVFRPHARGVFDDVGEVLARYIVTNSYPDSVITKLGHPDFGLAEADYKVAKDARALLALPLDYDGPVLLGDAKKYLVDQFWEGDDLYLPHAQSAFGHPVHLRRPNYDAVLQAITQLEGVESDDVVVGGDIFELDLLRAMRLGMHIVQITGPYTPDFELEAVRKYDKGHVVDTLPEMRDVMLGL